MTDRQFMTLTADTGDFADARFPMSALMYYCLKKTCRVSVTPSILITRLSFVSLAPSSDRLQTSRVTTTW
jgi:hypothetical protein